MVHTKKKQQLLQQQKLEHYSRIGTQQHKKKKNNAKGCDIRCKIDKRGEIFGWLLWAANLYEKKEQKLNRLKSRYAGKVFRLFFGVVVAVALYSLVWQRGCRHFWQNFNTKVKNFGFFVFFFGLGSENFLRHNIMSHKMK
jgi:hypothetical protein